MKFSTLILVVVMAACVKSQTEMLVKLTKECKDKIGLSDVDLAKLMAHGPAETKDQKCFIKCFLEKENIVKDGKIFEAGVLELTKKLTNGDADKISAVGAKVAACQHIISDDDCDAAVKIVNCLKDQGDKLTLGI